MSFEHNSTGDDAGAEAGSADDLNSALSDNGEATFITEGDGQQKKPNPIILFGLLLAVAGGGYFWFSRGGPEAASAAPAGEDAANQTVTKFLDGGTKNIELMQKMLRDTEKVVQQFLNYPSMKQVPLGDLQTNPFRFRAAKADGTGAVSESEAAARKRREEERQAVLKAVGGLNLQSVIHSGSRKACMVNNTLYTEGQQVETFVVEKINPGSVVVKSGVYRFELKMQK
ncbi:MAG: hypothetical protein WBD40_24050 [Tepidisphaeraceae bacterium]